MRPVAPGRPGTEVIPTGWAAQHAAVVERTMVDAEVSLSDPSAPVVTGFDESTQQTTRVSAPPYWTGGARIQVLNQQGRQVVAAEDPETVASYLVVVPSSVVAGEGHLVRVTESDDPALTGQHLQVITVARGSHRWETDLFCSFTT